MAPRYKPERSTRLLLLVLQGFWADGRARSVCSGGRATVPRTTVDERRRTGQRRRGWPFVVAACSLLLIVLIALGWYVWFPSFRPGLRPGEQYGIDVSHHQGRIEWQRVARDGISFAYIKATEGGDFVDRRFLHNWTAAEQAGMARGAYHFFTLCTPGEVQARNFLRTVPPTPKSMAPAVDLELKGNCRARPDPAAVKQELARFLNLVESETRKTMVLYVGDDFEDRYPIRSSMGRPLWHRRVLRRPDVDGWIIWQVHGYARVDGIQGRVDLNVMRPASSIQGTVALSSPRPWS